MHKTIHFNRPDKTFMNKKTKNTVLTDTAVPNTHNLAKTITDKQNKYQELENENISQPQLRSKKFDDDDYDDDDDDDDNNNNNNNNLELLLFVKFRHSGMSNVIMQFIAAA